MDFLARCLRGFPAYTLIVPAKKISCVHAELLQSPHDPALMQLLYGLAIGSNEDPSAVHQRLRDVGASYYTRLQMGPPVNFAQTVLAAMFSAPWTTDAYMEYVLDVFA